jgi:Domain of unknown function (DUF4365)
MVTRKPEGHRKTRTREHVIGDLAVNHVERQVLMHGFTMEPVAHDYGYDAIVFVYNAHGEAEEGVIFLQVKSTEKADKHQDGQMIGFRLDRSDLQRWLVEPMPVILCLYDSSEDRTHWLYIQNYFESISGFNLFQIGATTTVRLPTSQVLTPDSVGQFARYLHEVLQQTAGRVHHV